MYSIMVINWRLF